MLPYIFKSSHHRCSMKKDILRFSQNSQENNCARVSFLLKFFNKIRLWHRCFHMNFVKFLRTPFHRIPLDDCFCMLTYVANITQAKLIDQNLRALFKICEISDSFVLNRGIKLRKKLATQILSSEI